MCQISSHKAEENSVKSATLACPLLISFADKPSRVGHVPRLLDVQEFRQILSPAVARQPPSLVGRDFAWSPLTERLK